METSLDQDQRIMNALRRRKRTGAEVLNQHEEALHKYERRRSEVRAIRANWLRYFKQVSETA